MRIRIGIACLILLLVPAAAEPPGPRISPRVYLEEFHLRSDGQPKVDGWRDGDAEEMSLAVLEGCAALGFSCAAEGGRGEAVRYLRRKTTLGRYSGTAIVERIRGEHYYARFRAPPGFTTCRAGIFLKEGDISRGASFAGSIQRAGDDGLVVFADLGAGPAPRAIEFRLLVQYVAAGGVERRRCWPDLTVVFLCSAGRCRAGPSYPETYLR